MKDEANTYSVPLSFLETRKKLLGAMASEIWIRKYFKIYRLTGVFGPMLSFVGNRIVANLSENFIEYASEVKDPLCSEMFFFDVYCSNRILGKMLAEENNEYYNAYEYTDMW